MTSITQSDSVKIANPLGTAPVTRLIAKYAIPAILGMLVTAAYNITDQIFIGNIVGDAGQCGDKRGIPHGNADNCLCTDVRNRNGG